MILPHHIGQGLRSQTVRQRARGARIEATGFKEVGHRARLARSGAVCTQPVPFSFDRMSLSGAQFVEKPVSTFSIAL
jgi:hypothetical protein